MIIALTGGIASGKTAVSQWLSSEGITCIDTDQIARQVVEPGERALQLISEHFGEQVLDHKGQLNRRALRQIVFNHDDERQWLEQCLHPRIEQRMLEQCHQATSAYVILVIPLLVESGWHRFADRVLVVDVAPQEQLRRICVRDHVPYDQACKVVASQSDREQRLALADDIIENNGDLATLHLKIAKLHRYYLKLAAASA